MSGIVVDLDEKTVRTDGNGAPRQGDNIVAPAGGMGGVDDNGEVADGLDGGNGADIEGIPGIIREGADTPFAENDTGIAFRHDIFGGHEPFIDSGGEAALEENRFFRLAGQAQQGVVLHVPGANLDDIGVFFNCPEIFAIGSLGDDEQAGLAADFIQYLESFFAQALEGIGGGAGLEGTATKDFGAVLLDDSGDGERLLFTFHGTRASHNDRLAGADGDITDGYNGRVRVGLAADELVGFGDGDSFLDAFHSQELGGIDGAFVADDTDGRPQGARHGNAAEPHFLDFFNDGLHLGFGGVVFHDNEHDLSSP